MMPLHSTDDTGAPIGDAPSFQFDYIKSNFFRVIQIDGAIGGLSPSGMINVALYNERVAIPQSVTHEVVEGGGLGRQIGSIGRPGFVREIEFDAFLTIPTAETLIVWLQERVAEGKARIEALAQLEEE